MARMKVDSVLLRLTDRLIEAAREHGKAQANHQASGAARGSDEQVRVAVARARAREQAMREALCVVLEIDSAEVPF